MSNWITSHHVTPAESNWSRLFYDKTSHTVFSDPVIGWVTKVSTDEDSEHTHITCSAITPGMSSNFNDDVYLCSPDGQVIAPEIETWDNVVEWKTYMRDAKT